MKQHQTKTNWIYISCKERCVQICVYKSNLINPRNLCACRTDLQSLFIILRTVKDWYFLHLSTRKSDFINFKIFNLLRLPWRWYYSRALRQARPLTLISAWSGNPGVWFNAYEPAYNVLLLKDFQCNYQIAFLPEDLLWGLKSLWPHSG